MKYLPVFLDVRGQRCVVVGGGEVAYRKAGLLLRAGARVTAVSPDFGAGLEGLLSAAVEKNITLRREPFKAGHLDGAVLAVAATDDKAVNQAVSEAASAQGIPVNVVDAPALCSFIMPSIVDRDPLLVAISSGGASPLLTRQVKALNETMLPARMDELARLLAEYRPRVQEVLSSPDARRRFWEEVLESEVPELVYSGKAGEAARTLEALLARHSREGGNPEQETPPYKAQQQSRWLSVLDSRLRGNDRDETGEVYLVGAGPGDPDLLTLRALRLMHKADVVLYDRLVSAEILQRLRPDAERIYVGKQPGKEPAAHTPTMHTSTAPSVAQGNINETMLRLAGEGKRVLRLKGGDPLIFGRGGEELQALAEAGVPFQVVPGITAASGCAAYLGIPLTHRELAHSVRFLTGHCRGARAESAQQDPPQKNLSQTEPQQEPQDDDLNLNWADLVQDKQTLVFYMGLLSLPVIVARLLQHGMAREMPVAVVQRGTTVEQKVLWASLGDVLEKAAAEPPQPPGLIIIGEVVGLGRVAAAPKTDSP